MRKEPILTAFAVIVIIMIAVWACLEVRRQSWDRLLRHSFCRYATINNLEVPLKCMQIGDEATAQRDAMKALARAAGCKPVTFACWQRLFESERRRHGDTTTRDALRFLGAWCLSADGLLRPPLLS